MKDTAHITSMHTTLT